MEESLCEDCGKNPATEIRIAEPFRDGPNVRVCGICTEKCPNCHRTVYIGRYQDKRTICGYCKTLYPNHSIHGHVTELEFDNSFEREDSKEPGQSARQCCQGCFTPGPYRPSKHSGLFLWCGGCKKAKKATIVTFGILKKRLGVSKDVSGIIAKILWGSRSNQIWKKG